MILRKWQRRILSSGSRSLLRGLGVLLVLGLVACTTKLSAAKKLLEEGLYLDAANAYEKILANDPDNGDAKIGLAKARAELWKKELVSIRLMRMSGNGKGSLERLEELLERTAAWDLSRFQSGDLVSAEEEVRNGRRVLDLMIREQLNDKKPVVASFYWNKFNRVREVKQFGSHSSAIYNDIESEGQKLCERLHGLVSATSFSFNSVYKGVCAYYGAPEKTIELDFKQDYRFSKIDLDNRLNVRKYESTADAQGKIIVDLLDERLKKVGLFSGPSPLVLSTELRGDFVRDYQARQTRMAHSYTENVEYKEMEEYEDVEYVQKVENGVARSVPRTVKKTRPVKKYRTENRTHRYLAVQHNERLRLSLTLASRAPQEFSMGYAQDKDNNFVTHEENLPHIGLRRLEPKFMVVSDWLKEHYIKLADQFVQKLALTAADKFCQAVRTSEMSKEGAENFSRCAELNPKNSAATAWYSSTFGLTRAEVLEVVGKLEK